MLQVLRQFSIINRLFNVEGSEWSKIFLSWLIRFLYRIGFVVGWTMIVAMFVGRHGIYYLPHLFVINAVFSILGSFFYSSFLDRFSKERLMVFSILGAVALLFVAGIFAQNLIVYFTLLIVAEAIFLLQFQILLFGFIEELFSPIASEKAFPLIEAADTLGGIAAGFMITILATHINTQNFVYLWIAILLLIIPCILAYKLFFRGIKSVGNFEKKIERGFLTKLKSGYKDVKSLGFVKGLFLIIFFQWLLFNLLEFQYTRAVYQNASHVIMEAGSGFEHVFFHDLGVLFMLFSCSALIVQLLVAGRLLNSLGIIGTMLLHPIVTLLSLLGLISSFGFYTAVLAKNNFTVTTVLYNNSYHATYYAIREKLREYTREMLDGVVRPIAAIFGTLLLIVLQLFFTQGTLVFVINALMIAVAGVMFYVVYRQQHRYTVTAINDLRYSKDLDVRLNAIDILAQRGHSKSLPVLVKILKNEREPISVRIRILKSLTILKCKTALDDIINCLRSKERKIVEAALEALLAFKFSDKRSDDLIFQKYQLTLLLKSLYQRERSNFMRVKIVRLFAKISSVASLEFLLKVLRNDKDDLKDDALIALGNYDAPEVAEIAKRHLKSRKKGIRIAALIALGKCKGAKYHSEILSEVKKLVSSKNTGDLIGGMLIIGELKLSNYKKVCYKYLDSKQKKVKMHSAIALAKLGVHDAVYPLVQLIFSNDKSLSRQVVELISDVDVIIFKNIDKIVKDIVRGEVDQILDEGDELVDDLSNLRKLRWYYSLVEEYDQVDLIDSLIQKKYA